MIVDSKHTAHSTAPQSLEGKTVVLTRTTTQNQVLKDKLKDLNASVIELPLVSIQQDTQPETLKDVWAEISSYEWIVFTSVNGVNYFFNYFFKQFKDIRCIGGMRIACVGAGTAKAVESFFLQVDLVPSEPNASALSKALIETNSLDSAKVLVITGNRNRETLVHTLEKEGNAIVDQCPVYRTELTDLSKNKDAKIFREKGADFIIFSSPSAVESFCKQAKSLQLSSNALHPKAVSIGPVTSDAMKTSGLPIPLEATDPSPSGIVAALLRNH